MKRIHGGTTDPALLDFSANVVAWGPPRGVAPLLERELKRVASYPSINATPLRQAIARFHHIPQETILVGNGSSELIYLTANLFSRKGGARVITPAFTEYQDACEAMGMRVNCGDEAVTFLGNPNNPDGSLKTKAEILKLKGTLVVDEAFIDFAGDQESLLHEATQNPRLIVLRTLTKFYALAGLRVGYLVAAPEIVKQLKELQPPWSVNSLAILAGIEALNDKSYQIQTKCLIEEERAILFQNLKKVGLNPTPSVANFILCHVPDAKWLCEELLKKKMVLRNCDSFDGLENNRFVRIAVRTCEENNFLCQTLETILKAQNKKQCLTSTP